MDEPAIRAILADGLEQGAVSAINRARTRAAWLAGTEDLPFAGLDMDSLARMELCIAIEVGTGIALAPADLDRYQSIGELARDLARMTDA